HFRLLSIGCLCFFFQAEDGIRDGHVTGVQTCALPILRCASTSAASRFSRHRLGAQSARGTGGRASLPRQRTTSRSRANYLAAHRSEERRVGKECRSRTAAYHVKEDEKSRGRCGGAVMR